VKTPRISGKDLIKILQRADFEIFDHEGSHFYLHKWHGKSWSKRVTVPVHSNKILKIKTLKSILEQAGLSIDELIKLL
jgi:predicted RNA binding protein YcfA (HicA-like mRNA interferase family)